MESSISNDAASQYCISSKTKTIGCAGVANVLSRVAKDCLTRPKAYGMPWVVVDSNPQTPAKCARFGNSGVSMYKFSPMVDRRVFRYSSKLSSLCKKESSKFVIAATIPGYGVLDHVKE